jgi:hypothetical protein
LWNSTSQQKERDERRIKERAAYLEAERKRNKDEEDEANRKLQEKAVADFVKKQEELRGRNEKQKENLRKELAKLPVGLDPAQIQASIDKIDLPGNDSTPDLDLLAKLRIKDSRDDGIAESSSTKTRSSRPGSA